MSEEIVREEDLELITARKVEAFKKESKKLTREEVMKALANAGKGTADG